jgi:hypothetical protein
MSNLLPDLHLRLCPECEGQEPARGDCTYCEQAGVFDQHGKPFHAPPPFDGWAPERLVALSAGQAVETLAELPPRPARRMSQRELVERLLTALNRGGQDHSTIELSRNAKGDTQFRVSVRTDETGIETVDDAYSKAREIYDALCELYPLTTEGKS